MARTSPAPSTAESTRSRRASSSVGCAAVAAALRERQRRHAGGHQKSSHSSPRAPRSARAALPRARHQTALRRAGDDEQRQQADRKRTPRFFAPSPEKLHCRRKGAQRRELRRRPRKKRHLQPSYLTTLCPAVSVPPAAALDDRAGGAQHQQHARHWENLSASSISPSSATVSRRAESAERKQRRHQRKSGRAHKAAGRKGPWPRRRS